jgi:hypothetical protein
MVGMPFLNGQESQGEFFLNEVKEVLPEEPEDSRVGRFLPTLFRYLTRIAL